MGPGAEGCPPPVRRRPALEADAIYCKQDCILADRMSGATAGGTSGRSPVNFLSLASNPKGCRLRGTTWALFIFIRSAGTCHSAPRITSTSRPGVRSSRARCASRVPARAPHPGGDDRGRNRTGPPDRAPVAVGQSRPAMGAGNRPALLPDCPVSPREAARVPLPYPYPAALSKCAGLHLGPERL
jgi:hypothetical protein